MTAFLTRAVKNMKRTEVSTTYAGIRNRMRHAMMGLADEAGELTKMMLRSDFYRQPVNVTDYKDELGDILWYLCLAIDDLAEDENKSITTIAEEILDINEAKLRIRYPENYSNEQARTRDTETEKEAVDDVVSDFEYYKKKMKSERKKL